MNMYRRLSPPDYIIFGFLALGILSSFLANPAYYMIPILVLGTIFLLYKFPPARYRKPGKNYSPKRTGASPRQNERERRKNSFRVIYGNKPDNEDEPPRYH